VADYGNHRVQRFSHDGAFELAWGGQGGEPGQLSWPWGIDVDEAGRVVVSDFANHRIQRFTADGELVDLWGSYGWVLGRFQGPLGVDFGNRRVQRFAPALPGSHGRNR
jgi:hypothetical protein